MCFGVFLVHPTVVSVLLSASVERCFVSRMRDFSFMDLIYGPINYLKLWLEFLAVACQVRYMIISLISVVGIY